MLQRISIALLLTALWGCGGSGQERPGDLGLGDLRSSDAGRDQRPADGGTDVGVDAAPDSAYHDTGLADTALPDTTAPPCPTSLAGTSDDAVAYHTTLACLTSAAPSPDKKATIASFIHTVESRGGFPIAAGQNRYIFVYVKSPTWDREDDKLQDEDYAPSRRQEPIRVAGTFNSWSPTGLTLSPAGEGLYHLQTTVAASPRRQRYKFVAQDTGGADVWFSDPLARRFGYDTYGRYGLVHGGKDTQGADVGHLEWLRDIAATALGGVTRPIYVYVPPGYDTPAAASKRYPVLYMHDGNNAFDPLQVAANSTWDADATADAEIAAGRVRPMIIVAIPNNADRMNEYTHAQDIISAGGTPLGGKGAAYVDFIVQELKPLIDARYRTEKTREHTAILGSSLGGLISFFAGLRHPSTFKYVGGMSSTLGWGRFGRQNDTVPELYKKVQNLAARDQVYYLDSGGSPPCPPGSDNYCDTLAFRDQLLTQGISVVPQDHDAWPLTPTNVNLYYHHAPGAPHNEAAWRQRLHRPLRLFFRP